MSSRAALAVLILCGVFLPEFCVYANCRHCPFCRSDDRELDTSGRITSNKQAWNIGPLATASLDCIVAAQIAAKLDGQLGRLLRLGAEKQSLTVNDVAVLEADPLKARLATLQTSNWIFNDPDALPAESVAIFLCERNLSVGTKDNVTTPDGHLKRVANAVSSGRINSYGLIAAFPAIAVGAVMHASSPKLLEALNVGELIN